MSDPSNDIPPEFHSEYEGRPFQTCTRCGEMLAEIADGYQVFKLFRRGEPIYEYAVCHPCHSGIVREFSDESRRRLEEFHRDRISLNLGRWTCAVCGDARDEDAAREFSITGACQGHRLVHDLMICGGCRHEMDSLLSHQTREVWDRFVEENLPGVPAGTMVPGDLIPS
jgi:hypothetical protein